MAYPDVLHPSTEVFERHSRLAETYPASMALNSTSGRLTEDLKRSSESQENYRFRFWSASDYISRYREGKLTPLHVVQRLLREIKRTNATLKAWSQLHDKDILEAARSSTERYKANKQLSPLDGIPIAIKDEVKSLRTVTTDAGKLLLTRHFLADPARRKRVCNYVRHNLPGGN